MADIVYKALKDFVARFQTQAEAGKALGVSRQFVGQMLSRRADVPDSVLRKLGLKRVESIESIAE